MTHASNVVGTILPVKADCRHWLTRLEPYCWWTLPRLPGVIPIDQRHWELIYWLLPDTKGYMARPEAAGSSWVNT